LNNLEPEMTIVDGVIVYDKGLNPITSVSSENNFESKLPGFQLFQNYPNPFNPMTKIRYSLPEDSYVSIMIFDVLGNEVSNLVHKKESAGEHEIEFDASRKPSGIYMYRMSVTNRSGNYNRSAKMVVLK
jgi:hypothetical protein